MFRTSFYLALFALVASTLALPAEEYNYDLEPDYQFYRLRRSVEQDIPAEENEYVPAEMLYELHRERRSLQPGAPNIPGPSKQDGGWSVNPSVSRDDRGNTQTNVEVGHKGKNHDFNAGWGKVVRGPGKAKPTWHVGGTYKW
ncbi:coleoptericin [Tribolium castaneum]|uniref:Coleoptericin-like Protein n=1 Tax=Tribolium castaneum TaxID=7070 RepID=D2CFY8_TRICA|nr:PREDICTED: coleoptericin [Tribolium castaneum]EFA11854.1 Coleoptericin-like Protein [Tribolium castaneum]|eukprot:XP_008199794.1 PREDICTED: coleoptericin [Tribolium castaneum]